MHGAALVRLPSPCWGLFRLFGFQGALAAWLSPRSSSDLKVSHNGATRQAPERKVSKRTQSTVS
jgi:hypothetical protein